MASTKKKTTMAKIIRERKVRERRADKEARKQARKQAAAESPADGTDVAYPETENLAPAADPATVGEP